MSLGEARFTAFEDVNGEWRWHQQSRNGDLVASSSQGFRDKEDAKRAIVGHVNLTLAIMGRNMLSVSEEVALREKIHIGSRRTGP